MTMGPFTEEESGIYPPPYPSTPRRAPWDETAELNNRLKALIEKMEALTVAVNNLIISGGAGYPPNADDWRHGQKDIATTDTAVRLTDQSIPIRDGYKLTIIAKPGNSDAIILGKSKGDAEEIQQVDGIDPGLAVSMPIDNVNKVWITGTAADGVSWFIPVKTI